MLKWIEIDTQAIANNIRVIRKNTRSKIMVVVKADAYGHGIEKVGEIAQNEKVDFLGVINIDEARRLRESGIKTPIMILSPSLDDEIPQIIKYNIIPTVDRIDFLKKLSSYGKKVDVNLDIDTGLKRWGIDIPSVYDFIKKASKMKRIRISYLSTHIAYTPYKNMIDAKEKLERFNDIASEIKKTNPNLIAHAANSLVFLDFPTYHLDMVRIGNLIYGIYPSDIYLKRENSPIKIGIQKPWRFFARIVSVKKVKKGESFGYASEIVATKDTEVASVVVGYSDGLGMFPTENTYTITEGQIMWALYRGRKAYFIGKPSISHTLIDVTRMGAKVGDVVQMWIRRTAARNIAKIYV